MAASQVPRDALHLVKTRVKGTVVTIGNFDGVHLGHQEIVRVAIEKARVIGAEPLAFTFRPHPQSVLRPDRAPALLLTYDEKCKDLLSLGLLRVVEQPFDLSFSKTTPREFFEGTLVGRLAARAVVVGYDFTFGKERSGHLQVLQELCDLAGVELTVVAPQRLEQEVVSSSMIRQLLQQGQVGEAARLLGRPFSYQGTVMQGDQRGRTIGFPTANLSLGQKLVLPHGVFATWSILDGVRLPSVTNIGIRPTFHASGQASGPEARAETHLLDGQYGPDSLYGRSLRVEFVARIREEQKFAGVSELASQISEDIQKTRQILGA